MKSSSGQALILALIALLVFLIAIPALVSFSRLESLWTVKERKTTAAFHAADTGINQALWMLRENPDNWTFAQSNGFVNAPSLHPGYSGATTYNVYSEKESNKIIAQYYIRISAAPNDDVRIACKAIDYATARGARKETRAIEIIVSRRMVEGPLIVGNGLEYKPNLVVHWGPVVCYGSILDEPKKTFPRKYCSGSIAGWDEDPTPPNSEEKKQYWAFEKLGDPPKIDLELYKTAALANPLTFTGSGIKKTNGGDNALCAYYDTSVPPKLLTEATTATGSRTGYFRVEDNVGGSGTASTTGKQLIRFKDVQMNETVVWPAPDPQTVIYIACSGSNQGVELSNNTFLNVKALIVEGNCDFNAKAFPYTAHAPDKSHDEYLAPAHDSYQAASTYEPVLDANRNFLISDCGFRGFLYVGQSLLSSSSGGSGGGSGNASMVGVIYFGKNEITPGSTATTAMNTMTIYYDNSIKIDYKDRPFRVTSWRERPLPWDTTTW